MVDQLKESYSPNNDTFFQWWYDSNKGLAGKSPDELCKEGKQNELEKKLMDIFTAAHGG